MYFLFIYLCNVERLPCMWLKGDKTLHKISPDTACICLSGKPVRSKKQMQLKKQIKYYQDFLFTKTNKEELCRQNPLAQKSFNCCQGRRKLLKIRRMNQRKSSTLWHICIILQTKEINVYTVEREHTGNMQNNRQEFLKKISYVFSEFFLNLFEIRR